MEKLNKKTWDKAFKKEGKIFVAPQEDMPRIVEFLKKAGVKKVLDLGCGSGRHLVYLAKHGFEVYGIDIAKHGIEIAEDWLKRERLKAYLEIDDVYNRLPYNDNFFDAVISTQTLYHGKIEDIQRLIKEIERILKPKGLIFVTVRKRKFKKFWPKSKIIERYGKQTTKYKVIGPRTYIPIEKGEKGLIHYLFNKKIIKQEFKNFKIYDIWVESKGKHYCLLAELK